MAVVTFDPAQFKLAFPEFASAPDARLQILFDMVGSSVLDNTNASIVTDLTRRQSMLFLLVAHMLAQFGTGVAGGGAGSGPSGVVGRLSSATEGSVSSSFAFDVPASPGSAWFNQTQYGAMYWMLMAPFRSFRYVVSGVSGVGRAVAYGRDLYSIGHARYVAPVGPITPTAAGSYMDAAGNQYADELGNVYISGTV